MATWTIVRNLGAKVRHSNLFVRHDTGGVADTGPATWPDDVTVHVVAPGKTYDYPVTKVNDPVYGWGYIGTDAKVTFNGYYGPGVTENHPDTNEWYIDLVSSSFDDEQGGDLPDAHDAAVSDADTNPVGRTYTTYDPANIAITLI